MSWGLEREGLKAKTHNCKQFLYLSSSPPLPHWAQTLCYETAPVADDGADFFAAPCDLLPWVGAGCIDFFKRTDMVPAAAADPERLSAETGRDCPLEPRVAEAGRELPGMLLEWPPLTEEDDLGPCSGVLASVPAEGGLPLTEDDDLGACSGVLLASVTAEGGLPEGALADEYEPDSLKM